MIDKDVIKILHKTLDVEDEDIIKEIKDEILNGMSAIVKCKHYIGNGNYRGDKYKYKLITPFTDGNNIFSTDIYTGIQKTKKASYGIYNGYTLAVEISRVIETNFSKERFSDFYLKRNIGLVFINNSNK